jgi:glutamate dehydrogenase (NAD(P)+)
MRTGFAQMVAAAERHDTDWRTAAQIVAIERVAQASRLRAIYP